MSVGVPGLLVNSGKIMAGKGKIDYISIPIQILN